MVPCSLKTDKVYLFEHKKREVSHLPFLPYSTRTSVKPVPFPFKNTASLRYLFLSSNHIPNQWFHPLFEPDTLRYNHWHHSAMEALLARYPALLDILLSEVCRQLALAFLPILLLYIFVRLLMTHTKYG